MLLSEFFPSLRECLHFFASLSQFQNSPRGKGHSCVSNDTWETGSSEKTQKSLFLLVASSCASPQVGKHSMVPLFSVCCCFGATPSPSFFLLYFFPFQAAAAAAPDRPSDRPTGQKKKRRQCCKNPELTSKSEAKESIKRRKIPIRAR